MSVTAATIEDQPGLRGNGNVPSGYKRTEIGVIPEDWDVSTLGELTILLTNGFVGKATDYYTERDDGVLYIQGYNVLENGFNLHGVKYVTRAFHTRHQKSCLRPGDLLTIQTGDIGVTTIVPSELAGANCHALVISRFDTAASVPHFYCQYFNSERGRSSFTVIETGSTMKHLNVGDMESLFLPAPPVTEQRTIAATLSDVDRLISSLDKVIAKKRATKLAAMQQLLTGKIRLPGFTDQWAQKRLDVVAEIVMGQSPLGSSYNADGVGVPLINGPTEFTNKHPIRIQWTTQPTKLCRAGDLLLCVRGSSTGRINLADDVYCIGRGIAAIRAKPGSDTRYITYQIVSAIRKILTLTAGSTFPNIDGKSIRAIELSLPCETEQAAISSILTDMDSEIAALERRRDKIKAIKQGMMQALLTGRIRLVKPGAQE